MRAAACLTLVLTGCSPLLGIQDPSSRTDASVEDAPPDGTIDGPEHVDGSLEISLGAFKLAREQTVNLRVRLRHTDSTIEDVTDRARLESSDTAIATTMTGRVDGVSAGDATITARLGDAPVATVTATVTAALCHPVINELMTGSNGDATREFVELYNPCNHPVSVADWTLNYRGGATTGGTDSNTMILLKTSMPAGAIRVYAGSGFPAPVEDRWIDSSGMKEDIGAVGLRNGTGVLIDSVAYGAVAVNHPFAENNQHVPTMMYDKSASRLPFDGRDDNDNATDFQITTTPTPRLRNVP